MNRRIALAASLLLTAGAVSVSPAREASAACVPSPGVTASGTDVAAAAFAPIEPVRIADTRVGLGVPTGRVDSGCVLHVPVAAADPPGGATGVAVTLTAANAEGTGYVTAFACGSPRPETSSLNPRPGDPTSNLAVIELDATRELCFYSSKPTDLIVDVTGWFAPGPNRLHDITPTRVFDSRTRGATARVPERTSVRVQLAGRFIPTESTAVAATLTITGATGASFATAYPCGTVPPTSTTNVLQGQDRGSPALVGLDTTGGLCLYTEQAAHLVLDITGWFGDDLGGSTTAAPGAPLELLGNTRILDTRNGTGTNGSTSRVAAGAVVRIPVLGAAALGTTAVQLSLIATGASAAGYLTAFPCDQPVPATSAVNFRAGGTETAMVTVGLGADDGSVCVVTSAAAHVVADLFAAYGTPGSLHSIATSPTIDQAYRSGQLDHTLHCPSGGGAVTLAIDPAPGVAASIDGRPAANGFQRVTTTLAEDAAIVVRLSGLVTEEHWVRCLPATFPVLTPTGVSPTPGWYVASSLAGTGYVFILDEYGVPVWYKRTPAPVVGVWPQANGNLAWRIWSGGGFPGGAGLGPENPPRGFEIHDLTGALVGSVGPVGGTEPLDWHELLDLPGGGHLVLTYPLRTTGTSRSCTKATGGTTTTNQVVDSVLVELDAAGTEVWRWDSKDHTDIATETTHPICFNVTANSANGSANWALDYMHLNSVERLTDGDYVIGARHFDSIARIDHTTKNVEWKLGGSAPTTGVRLTLLDINGAPAGAGTILNGPHDARVLPNGNITVHDNHLGGVPRASEFRLDLTAGTARLVWQHLDPNSSGGTLGSVRRQPDGSTVIGWGEGTSPWLEEVAADGSVSLAVTLPGGTTSYRVVKLPAAAYTRQALRAAAGGSTA